MPALIVQDFFTPGQHPGPECQTALEAGSEVDGRLVCTGPARIAGKVTGEISAQGDLVIEKSSRVEADITAETVVVHGRVKGRLVASVSVTLCETAVFEGELEAPTVRMEVGARFDGASHISGSLREADPSTDDDVPSPVHKLQGDLEAFLG